MIEYKTINFKVCSTRSRGMFKKLHASRLYNTNGVMRTIWRDGGYSRPFLFGEQSFTGIVTTAFDTETNEYIGAAYLPHGEFYGWDVVSLDHQTESLNDYYGFIGVYVKPIHRNKGVATEILNHMFSKIDLEGKGIWVMDYIDHLIPSHVKIKSIS